MAKSKNTKVQPEMLGPVGKPNYHKLKCPACGNKEEFCEHAYTETQQTFYVGGPQFEPDWYSFDPGEHHPTQIYCGNCEALVWEAK